MVAIGLGFLLLATTGCASVSAPWRYVAEPIEGRVIDKETRQPIEGVVVVAQWILLEPFQGHHREHWVVIETVTDAEGRYQIPGWGPKWRPWFRWLGSADPVLDIFKPGYWLERRSNASYASGGLLGTEPNPIGAKVRKSFWSGKKIELYPFRIGKEVRKQLEPERSELYPPNYVVTEEDWANQVNGVQSEVAWGGQLENSTAEEWLKIKNLVLIVEKECSNLPSNLRQKLRRVPEEYKSILFGDKKETCL